MLAQDLCATRSADFILNFMDERVVEHLGASPTTDAFIATLKVREVHASDELTTVDANFRAAFGNVHTKVLPYKHRVFALFQKQVCGGDVFVIAIHVSEYDHACPAPNTSIAYLSLVENSRCFTEPFTRPGTSLSTMINEWFICGYLGSAGARGFKQVHLWPAPPSKGQCYIFNGRLPNPVTSARGRLVKFYNGVIRLAKKHGISSSSLEMCGSAFGDLSGESLIEDVALLPYNDGICWCQNLAFTIPRTVEQYVATVVKAVRECQSRSFYAVLCEKPPSPLETGQSVGPSIMGRSQVGCRKTERLKHASSSEEGNDVCCHSCPAGVAGLVC